MKRNKERFIRVLDDGVLAVEYDTHMKQYAVFAFVNNGTGRSFYQQISRWYVYKKCAINRMNKLFQRFAADISHD